MPQEEFNIVHTNSSGVTRLYKMENKKPNESHFKAIKEKSKGYPDRFPVALGTTWETVSSDYHPQDYTAEIVLQKPYWADPEDPKEITHTFDSYEGEIKTDGRGRPLNPLGPTGLEGRGLLGKWGPNFAADPIVTRINNDGKIEMIVIKRSDTGEDAIPGGMVDKGEKITATLKRELGEETSAEIDFENARKVYQGYVDDPRNTDNAWMETDVYHLHLEDSKGIELKPGDDATNARWEVISEEFLNSLYASHGEHVRKALALWESEAGKTVNQAGMVKNNILRT